jgi:hypothetical protein
VEDFTFPIQDLSGVSPRSAHDAQFTYCFADINRVASDLGVVFASDKDVPFGPCAPFTGLDFGFSSKDVGLPENKRDKYLCTLDTFLNQKAVTLKDVQSIYGKLLHTCAVVPEGRAYLTGLKSFISLFDDKRPFSTWHLSRVARAEPNGWWRHTLSLPLPRRPLPVATDIRDLLAFLDASSGVSVGVWICVTTGTQTDEALHGPRLRVSNSFSASLFRNVSDSVMRRFGATTAGSSRHGGMARAGTGLSTRLSAASTPSSVTPTSPPTPATSQVPTTLRTVPPEASTTAELCSSCLSSWASYPAGSSTSTTSTLSMTPSPLSVHAPRTLATRSASRALSISSSRTQTTQSPAPSSSILRQASFPPAAGSTSVPCARNSFLVSHPACPHVLCREHLEKWIPFQSRMPRSAAGNLIPLSAADLERTLQVTALRWAKSTLTSYGTGLMYYHEFCDARDIAEESHTLVSTELMQTSLAVLVGAYSVTTIKNASAGVQAWHCIHGIEWRVPDGALDVLYQAALACTLSLSWRRLRNPVRTRLIEQIYLRIDWNLAKDLAWFACLTTVFHATACLGEFGLPTIDAFDAAKHVTPAHVSKVANHLGNEVTQFKLPWTKVLATGKTVFWAKQAGPSDLEDTLERHLAINAPPTDGPLFTYKQGRYYEPMTRVRFLTRLNQVCQELSVPAPHGHGFCIGSTLELLLHAGVTFEVAKTKGR